MTLTELKYIVAVAKERHFRKASEICFVSQPTLSVAVKKIEDELGVILFERRKQDILITPIGEKIVAISQSILDQSQAIKQLAKEAQGNLTTELKIGVIYTIAPYLLPKLIPNFRNKAPKIPVIIEENYTETLAKKLQSGDIDIAILSLPFDEPNIETFTLYEEPFKFILPKLHPKLNNDHPISENDIKNETLFLLGAGHCFRDQVVQAFPNLIDLNHKKNDLQKTFEGSSLETIRYMVASGAGISIFPCTSLTQHDESLFRIEDIKSPTPTRKVALAWRNSFSRLDVLELFKQSILELEVPCTIQS